MADNLISTKCAEPHHHLILQTEETGAYLFIFERADSPFPEKDYWFETKAEAMTTAQNDFGAIDWEPTSRRY
ncbi:hypothetical protein [Asticcacaulis sp.]|uniref:hypothetical protein n=1 Tax=Asticcacaulis sp. TaxID=1872648 RepID=UPI003F7CAA73